jgi:aspartyl-tRNA(Asn)/glutamyl-tRNA(Gln) amidotransferase subunit C
MRLTTEEVKAVAALARLGLSPDELERMREQLSTILSSIELINELDTASIPPTAQTIDLTNVMRDDVPRPSLPPEQVLMNAPRHRDGFFEVRTPFGTDEVES